MLWNAYATAKQWEVRPSELYDIEDSLLALQFDRAVGWFGSYVQEELDKIKTEGKKPATIKSMRQSRLEQILEGEKVQRFADPAEMMG